MYSPFILLALVFSAITELKIFKTEKGLETMRYVGLLLIVVVVVGAFNAAGDIGPAIDLLAFLFVIGIAVGHMLGSKDGDNRVTRFGDGAVRGGWLGFLVGIIMIASSPSAAQMDFSAMMPALAVAALTPLYGYFLKIITMQID